MVSDLGVRPVSAACLLCHTSIWHIAWPLEASASTSVKRGSITPTLQGQLLKKGQGCPPEWSLLAHLWVFVLVFPSEAHSTQPGCARMSLVILRVSSSSSLSPASRPG